MTDSKKHTDKIATSILRGEYADYDKNWWHYDREYNMLLKAQTEAFKLANEAAEQQDKEAIDTVVSFCKDPISPIMTQEEIIKLFNAAEYVFVDEMTSQLSPNKKLVFLKEGFMAGIWAKGQSVEDVVKVIATYEYMRGAEGGAE